MAIESLDIERLRSRLKVTSEISEAINQSLDLDLVLSTTLNRLLELYGISKGIIIVRSRTGALRIGCHKGFECLASSGTTSFPMSERAIAHGRSVIVSKRDVLAERVYGGDLSGIGSVISVPIYSNEDSVGVLHLASEGEDFFDSDDASFLEPLAHVVGVALTNARLYSSLRNELRTSKAINELARQVTEGSLELSRLLPRVARTLKEHFQLELCTFFALDALGTTLTSLEFEDSGHSNNGIRFQLRGEPLVYKAFRERKAVSESGSLEVERLGQQLNSTAGSIAVVPLVTNGLAVGLVLLGKEEHQGFTSGELDRLETVVAYIAGAMENARLYQESLDLNRDLIELESLTQLNASEGESDLTVRHLLEKAVFGTHAEVGVVYQGVSGVLSPSIKVGSNSNFLGLEPRMLNAARLAVSESRTVEYRLPTLMNGTLVAFPLRSISKGSGAMVIFKSMGLEERDRRLCSIIADRTASIIDNARLFEETRRHLNELTLRNEELVRLNRQNVELTDKLTSQLEFRRREAQLAADIQKSLLVDRIPQGADIDIAVSYLPLEEASGDYYDVFTLDMHRTGVVITDAVGHGVPAAFVGGFSKMLLDEYKSKLASGNTPGQVLAAINHRLCSYNYNQLMTMFLCVYDDRTRTLSYANGGHPYPVLVDAAGDITPLESRSHILGAWTCEFEDRSIELKVGDRLLFYTDGLVEAMDSAGKRLGKSPVLQWFREHREMSPAQLNQGLYRLLADFSHGRLDHDDITLLTIAVLENSSISGEMEFSTLEAITQTWSELRNGLTKLHYDPKDQYGIRLALEEAMANAVRHGCKDRSKAALEYAMNGRNCRFKVIDGGSGFNPEQIPDPTSPDKLLVSGGRGIFLMKKSVDEVRWNQSGNEVFLDKSKSRKVNILVTETAEGVDTMSDELKILSEAIDGKNVLAVAGAVDAVSSPQLHEAIEGMIAKGSAFVLDLGDVNFLGSAAVSILVKVFALAQSKGLKLAIIKPKDSDVSEMLEILGLLAIFPLAESREQAIGLLG